MNTAHPHAATLDASASVHALYAGADRPALADRAGHHRACLAIGLYMVGLPKGLAFQVER